MFNTFHKTLIVGTRKNRLAKAVLTSTHNVCFGSKIRKLVIPLQTRFFFFYIKWGLRGDLLHGNVSLMQTLPSVLQNGQHCAFLTHICRMNFPIIIIWVSPLSLLGASGVILNFYSIFRLNSFKQTE